MRSVPLAQVQLTDAFWSRYIRVLVEATLPAQYEQMETTGRFANFRRAAGNEAGTHEGLYFNDSDLYKYVEACAYALTTGKSIANADALKKVRAQMDAAIELVIAAQEPSGYLNTYFQLKHPDLKWRNLGNLHEMYCGGHMLEAGVAVFEGLGDRRLLDASIRFADHLLATFGPSEPNPKYPEWTGTRLGYCGHQEIELALIRLAEATNKPVYRALAEWMVESRGQRPSPIETEMADAEAMTLSTAGRALLLKDGKYSGEYAQDHLPIREHTEVVGHAVRAMYFYIAAAELLDGKEDEALREALERTWNNLTRKRMYVTGGIGPSAKNEGFTGDYDLPNLTAYAETCAACGLAFWGQAMLELTGNGDYADIIERALYNGILSGISLDGTGYFYDNPLESRGRHTRSPWFTCACCPPNIARLIGSVTRYAVGFEKGHFFVHQPISLKTSFPAGDTTVKIEIVGKYPFSGAFEVRVDVPKPTKFALHVRIPDWADEVGTELPGAEEEASYDSGYAVFDRVWKPGEVLKVDFGSMPKWVEADPRVRDNLGRVALTYGPLVYCAEAHDTGFAPQLFSADLEGEILVNEEKMLKGITTLTVPGIAESEDFVDGLYAEVGTAEIEEVSAKFIPYFAWANRGATDMLVWFRHT